MIDKQTSMKLLIKLEIINDYPPVSVESIWVKKLPSGYFKVLNIPFYSRELCFEDVVDVTTCPDGSIYFLRIKRKSKNSTIRIVFFDEYFDQKNIVITKLESLGCTWEEFSTAFLAINIPRETDLNEIIEILEQFSEKGVLDYEYGLLQQ
jgi:hypothetical protein